MMSRAAITVALNSATPERCFTYMHLIITPLRNRMSTPMLDALMRIALNEYSDDDIMQAMKIWWNAGDPDRIWRKINVRFVSDDVAFASKVIF